MYQPPHFREDRLDIQHALIRRHPLGLLVTHGPTGLLANPLPFLLDAGIGPLGTLRTHLARANPQWREADPAAEVLVVFQGPDAYVTPSWYATKAETGRVVPTWNYATVQAYGTLRVIDDPDWLRAQVAAVTRRQEAERAMPWAVDDAPAAFLDAQLRGIVGLELTLTRLEGKVKASQNRSEPDREGVARGLDQEGEAAMAALVAARGA